jgi:adenine-specific DNA-methyltransferase
LYFAEVFHEKDGFDIIIANPPYIRADSGSEHLNFRKKLEESKKFKTLYEKWDLIVPFVEKGLNITSNRGHLIYIISDSVCTSKYAYKLLDWIQEKYYTRSIDYFEGIEVFEAGVLPVVLHIGKEQGSGIVTKRIHQDSFGNIKSEIKIPAEKFKTLGRNAFRKDFEPITLKIETNKLGDICYISYGLRPNSDERYWKGEFTAKDIISRRQDKRFQKPYVEGKDLVNYHVKRIRYLEWGTERVPDKLVRPTFPELYNRNKIMRGTLTGGVLDKAGVICNHSIVVFVKFIDLKGVNNKSIQSSIKKFNQYTRAELERISEGYDLKYLLAIINSEFACGYLNNIRRHRLKNYFYPDDFRNLPIANILFDKQKPFIDLVDKILAITKDDDYLENSAKQAKVREYEKQIDQLVYKLYGLPPEEIKVVENHE